jgi:hypothetical protein
MSRAAAVPTEAQRRQSIKPMKRKKKRSHVPLTPAVPSSKIARP